MTDAAVSNKGFFISKTIKESWRIFKEDWIVVYALNILPFIFSFGFMYLSEKFEITGGLYAILYIAYLLISFVISMGVINAYLSVVRGKKVTMETFSETAPKILNFVVAQILLMFIILGGFLLFIVPGVIFSLKYMFTPYLVVDKGMGPIEAIKASGKLTDGIKWDLLGFIMAAVVLMYAGILVLFVGLIVSVPVATLSFVVLYNTLSKRSLK